MNLIENIQKLPEQKKIRIMWVVAIVVAMLLIIVWIISVKWQKRVDKDTSIFQTIGKGFKDIKDNYKK